MAQAEFPVVIIGGGVVGLCAALFLERAGVRCLLLERHPTTSIHPRARGVNGRSMELMRELGLEEAVRSAGERLAPAVGIYRGETLRAVIEQRGSGGLFGRLVRARAGRGRATKNSPTGPCRCTQDELEPLLLSAARARGVEARLYTEVSALEQDAQGVDCSLLDRSTGETSHVRAQYVIAADGARSPTRERLGLASSTRAPGGHQMNLYFKADMRELVREREFSLCLVEQPGLRGLFASIDNAERWVLHVSYDAEHGEGPRSFTPERCTELIQRATGIADLRVELKGALPWESSLRIVDRYRCGRVFLAGDAAHSMPPWGGFGANTGIQDAHNLAWKLGAVLSGRAGEALLESYEAERRPVALAVGAISASMNDAHGLIAVERSPLAMILRMRKIFGYLGVGYGYASPAVCVEAGKAPGPGSKDLRGRPGTRTPHVWFGDAGGTSSLDWLGRGHVLFVGSQAERWAEAAQLVAAECALALEVVQLDKQVCDSERRAARAFGIGRTGALLARPDGFVAWRRRSTPPTAAEAARELAGVLQRTLARV